MSDRSAARPDRRPFDVACVSLRGRDLVADRSGVLFSEPDATLVVADLHLEKASSLARRGQLLPPYDTQATLERLADAIRRYAPKRVIALGDSLHDQGAARRIGPDDIARLRALQAGRDWVWVTGNHDPKGAALGGEDVDTVMLGPLTLRHIPEPEAAPGEVGGHLHPVARLRLRGVNIRRACFVISEDRIIMPAFGALTGGLNVLDDAFRPLFAPHRSPARVLMLGDDGVYPVAEANLAPDR
jgi:DNA ligase-associated metallophosphoesterase